MYTSSCFITFMTIIRSLADNGPRRSAQSALLSVTHNWLRQLENGDEVWCVFFDNQPFSVTHNWLQQLENGEGCCVFFDSIKAFDSVPHSLLLQKLSEIEVKPCIIQWICNYLICRSQLVVVGGEQSCVLPVISGVPQGSFLGPLLFLVFINEVVFQVSLEFYISLCWWYWLV